MDHLSRLDPDLQVLCYSEDEMLLEKSRGFILLDILGVDTASGERIRLEDGTPYLKFGKGPELVTMAKLEVTSDF